MKNRAHSPSAITVALKMKASDLFPQNITVSQKHSLQQLRQTRGRIREAARKPQTREHANIWCCYFCLLQPKPLRAQNSSWDITWGHVGRLDQLYHSRLWKQASSGATLLMS